MTVHTRLYGHTTGVLMIQRRALSALASARGCTSTNTGAQSHLASTWMTAVDVAVGQCSSLRPVSDDQYLRLQTHRQQQKRWNGTVDNTTSSDESSEPSSSEPVIIYTSPMGKLISRLKVVSITSCVMSLLGLPMFVALKNGALPTIQQLSLGGVALFGATGSTLALHFVFGPYILELEKIPVRLCHFQKETDDDDDTSSVTTSDNQNNETPTTADGTKEEVMTSSKEFMLKATTRSVFGMRKEIVFDPLTDVTAYTGSRPFANFVAKNVTLYAHPELLEDQLRLQLLVSKTPPVSDEANKAAAKDDDDLF